MSPLLFLLSSVGALPFLEFNWISSDFCSGPPSTIYTYSDPNLSPHYQFAVDEWPFSKCYIKTFVAPDQCCHSSLDLAKSGGYLGFAGSQTLSATLLQDMNDQNGDPRVPSGANGQTYCAVQNSSSTTYASAFYLMDKTVCHEGYYRCTETALIVYAAAGCLGQESSFALSDTLTAFQSAQGVFQAKLWTMSHAPITYIYQMEYPLSLFTPLNKSAFEIFGTCCYAMALLVSVVAIVWYGRRYMASGIKFDLLLSITHVFWLLAEAMTIYTNYLTALDESSYLWTEEFYGLFQNLATVSTFYVNLKTMFDLAVHPSPRTRIGIYILAFLVHFVLIGYQYIYYLFWNQDPFVYD
ncbi:hypothetical protein HDU91_001950, partial [Kappamyces sp. JEL0680]